MIYIVKLLVSVLIVGLFLYSKLHVHESKLSPSFMKVYQPIKSLLLPILQFLNRFFKPYKIGHGLSIDVSQIVLLIALLIILRI